MIKFQMRVPGWATKMHTSERRNQWYVLQWLEGTYGTCHSQDQPWHWENDREAGAQFICFENPNDAILFKLAFAEFIK